MTPKSPGGRIERFLHEQTVLLLALIFLLAGGSLGWHQWRLNNGLIEEMALRDAQVQSEAIRQFRTLYTSEVVERVKGAGVSVTHDYALQEGAIPLPATFSMELAKRMSQDGLGTRTRLYSPYPFPWRSDGGLTDDFAEQAWKALQAEPTEAFVRFEDVDGRHSLRYATADLMRESCIACHNSHLETPKDDWQLGDVRGILEVTRPLDTGLTRASSGLMQALTVLAVLAAIALSCLWLVIGRLRGMSKELEVVVDLRTSELRRSEALYHSTIDDLPLSIFRKDRESRITFGNKAFLRDLRRPMEELRGKSDRDLFPPELAEKYRADDLRVMDAREEFHDVEEHLDGAGNRQYVEVLKTPIYNQSGDVVGTQCAYWDVTARKKIEESLLQSEARYRYLANALPQFVWTTGADGLVDYMNDRWAERTGMSTKDSLGSGWVDVLHPDDRQRVLTQWGKASDSGEPYGLEARFRMADGSYSWHLVRALPLRDTQEHIVRWFGTCTDIEDHKRVEDALLEAKAAAESANRSKSEFLANMSHEIRTPMNGIIGMTDLLAGTPLTEKQREYLMLVSQSADTLLRLLNDILDFSKIEAGKLSMEAIGFGLRDAVLDSLQTLSIQAFSEGLELACHVSPDVSDALVGDAGRLRQVLINLVGNAIKFTDEGEVAVRVELAEAIEEHDGETVLHFIVRDTGIGIPPDKLAHVFGAFSQADSTTTRRFGGTGLGLAISSQLVHLMGGEIWVESEERVGSQFHFTARFGLQRGPARAGTDVPASIEGVPILVVDDNATNRTILEEMLRSMRMRPVLVANGEDALIELQQAADRNEPYALVLLDVMMPGMDGYEVARRARALPVLAKTKLIVLSSAGAPDEVTLDGELGIERHLIKPVKQSALLNAIIDTLGSAVLPAFRTVPFTPITASSRTALRVLLAEDGMINRKLATVLLEEAGHTVAAALNGREALAAMERENFDLIVMDVHMPEMDGLETTRIIRERERKTSSHIPIIAMTADAMEGDRDRCLEAGMDGYVSKPIRVGDLEEAIQLVTRGT